MTFNFQTFKTRALTALIFVAVMLVGLLWNFWSFVVLFTVIHFGCWFEYFKLLEKGYNTKIDIVIKWLFAICGFTLMIVVGIHRSYVDIWTDMYGYKVSYKILFWLLLFILLLVFLFQNKQIPGKTKWRILVGLVYISLPISLFVNLRDDVSLELVNGSLIELGILTTSGVVFSIWVNDTMAYLVGSFIGKTPLSKISPKKTIEGTLGGVVLCIIVIGFLYPFLIFKFTGLKFEKMYWFIIPALCSIFGTLGDLFESKLKRMADVKDSGNFMPGHGGFLDRFDSLLFAIPAVWVYVFFFLR